MSIEALKRMARELGRARREREAGGAEANAKLDANADRILARWGGK